MENDNQYPLPTSPLYKTNDPLTSVESAESMRGSKRLGELQVEALRMVKACPGSTANELARICDSEDSRKIPRRLSELRSAGLIRSDGSKTDPITGKRCCLWWPVIK